VLHGLLGSSRNWQSTGADLAAHYHVLALDLRNHGRSPHSDEMTFDAMATDVVAWMDAHGFGRATLMGHSLGGKVAMLIADSVIRSTPVYAVEAGGVHLEDARSIAVATGADRFSKCD